MKMPVNVLCIVVCLSVINPITFLYTLHGCKAEDFGIVEPADKMKAMTYKIKHHARDMKQTHLMRSKRSLADENSYIKNIVTGDEGIRINHDSGVVWFNNAFYH